MMTPVKTKNTNVMLGEPKHWNAKKHGPCQSLPASQYDGVFYTYWQPSFLDRVKIMLGGNIRLALLGSLHPPVSLDTEIT